MALILIFHFRRKWVTLRKINRQMLEEHNIEAECSISEVDDLISELEYISRIDKHLLDTAASLFEL